MMNSVTLYCSVCGRQTNLCECTKPTIHSPISIEEKPEEDGGPTMLNALPTIRPKFLCPELKGSVLYHGIWMNEKFVANDGLHDTFIEGGLFYDFSFTRCYLKGCLLIDCNLEECIEIDCQYLTKTDSLHGRRKV